ncbi:MAG: TonB-dependent receptor [Rikenellaceae bacterium]|nr:TonB-dependent receptor [Rikenellaceae bacterium]
MKKLLLFLILLPASVLAQRRILVLDSALRRPVVGAEVYFPDLRTTTVTDAIGRFRVNALLVQISAAGYRTLLHTVAPGDSVLVLEPSHFDFQEVVVSGNSSRLQGENVVNVEKLDLSAAKGATSLAGKLATAPGLDVLSTGAGIGKPTIRGLSGNRIAVFSQGVRIENQQWGDEHGLGLDENGYGEVEIIKGPASLLYGSDAIGGALYFVGERYARENSVEADLHSEFHSNTSGWRNAGALKLSKNRLHANLFGGYTTHKDYADGNRNTVYNSRFHTGDFKAVAGYTGRSFSSSLKYSLLDEQYGLSEGEGDGEGENENEREGEEGTNGRKPDYPYQHLTTSILSSENTFFLRGGAKVKAEIGYVANRRREIEAEDDTALGMALRTASYNVRWYSPRWRDSWSLIAGSQGMYQTNSNFGSERLVPDATTVDAGAFALADYYIGKSYLQAGARIDLRQIDGEAFGAPTDEEYFPSFSKAYTAFNFSLGAYMPLSERLSLRANISSGYRAPTMFELLSDGIHEGTNRYETGSAELKTENSYQADLSLRHAGEHFELFASPFVNLIRRYIHPRPTGEMQDDAPVYQYVQSDACLFGGEAGFHLHPHPWDWLHLEGSYSGTFGRDDDGRPLPLMPMQRLNLTVRAAFSGFGNVVREFSVYVRERYSLAMNRIAAYETATPGYNLLGAGLSLDLTLGGRKVQLDATVDNLLNVAFYDHLSRYKSLGINSMGRNFTFGLRLPLGWNI